jgi:membrane protein YdbS with pleckstrin-like domain
MADVDDYLVETEPEPDEEAMSRRQQRIVEVGFVALGVIGAVEMSIILYYGIKNSNRALLALAFVPAIIAFGIGYHCFLHRHRFWKSLCEICNAEEELQIDP